ncbi:hypothetical protein BDK61_4783 [Haloarcula quadrata]|uniref:PadR family transcriptional regulator n=2 Tax=Haloarcula quadrata TaxID=182779 RepID=A0A495QMN8_9EURY|nr:hypothetical protein [Haloarcula sp. JP-Z28]RKS74196.1 hypothetical protein BDK61_4783 [Haloarcula quadrata]
MAENEAPMQPLSIYGGLIHQQNITFSYRTVQNKMSELVEKNHVKRVKIDTDDGVIRELADGSGGRAYYLITDAGRERVQSEVF